MMKAILGDQYIGGARRVAMTRSDEAEASVLTLEHDGWRRHGFTHRRRLSLAADGRSLVGEDALARTRGKREVAYALRFPPASAGEADARCRRLSVEIRLANRSLWRFEADGATIALEESVMFASTEGLRRTEQSSVQCETASRPQIAWVFRKMEGRRRLPPHARRPACPRSLPPMPTDLRRIQRALLSVSDKEGLIPFAEALAARGVEVLSTGGTRAALAAAGLPSRMSRSTRASPRSWTAASRRSIQRSMAGCSASA